MYAPIDGVEAPGRLSATSISAVEPAAEGLEEGPVAVVGGRGVLRAQPVDLGDLGPAGVALAQAGREHSARGAPGWSGAGRSGASRVPG
jgi:hypothetical protein